MYLTIMILPFLGGVLASTRWTGVKVGPIISIICCGISALLSSLAFYEVGLAEAPVYINLGLGHWLNATQLSVEWSLVFDSLTVSMIIPVMWVSFLVQLYSYGYMDGDPHVPRFFCYLSLFSFLMLVMITGENLLLLFVGWEGIGLTSYLLVNFYHTQLNANFSSLKAFLLNRVGDMALTIAIIIALCAIGDNSFAIINGLAHILNPDLILILVICLLIGAGTKSGQAILSGTPWLASAMAAPSPVSALLHSATICRQKSNWTAHHRYKGKTPITPNPNVKALVVRETAIQGWDFSYSHPKHYPQELYNYHTFTSFQMEAFIGLMLSDATLTPRYTKKGEAKAMFVFPQSIVNFPFFYHCWVIFRAYCASEPDTYSGLIHKLARTFTVRFRTRSTTYLGSMHKIWYNSKGIKVVPRNINITPVSLAFWLMGDGGISSSGTTFLCTDAFSKEDQLFLIEYLYVKFGLIFYLRPAPKGGYRMYLATQSKAEFTKLVQPHMIPFFMYKLDKNYIMDDEGVTPVIANKAQPVFVYDLDMNFVTSYPSLTKAAEGLGVTHVTIGRYCRSGKVFQTRYYLSFSNRIS